jgi:hypothetical protein
MARPARTPSELAAAEPLLAMVLERFPLQLLHSYPAEVQKREETQATHEAYDRDEDGAQEMGGARVEHEVDHREQPEVEEQHKSTGVLPQLRVMLPLDPLTDRKGDGARIRWHLFPRNGARRS